ncbi:MAG TPA: flagellar filament capping protein FliD [Paralcaligenes sp.]|jgi:flagellar hook-associated protein 2
MADSVSSRDVGARLPPGGWLTSARNKESHTLVLILDRQIAVRNRLSAYEKIRSCVARLKSITDTQAKTLSIASDSAAIEAAANELVSAYNDLQTTIHLFTACDAGANIGAVLTGDSLALRVQNQVRAALNVATSSGAVRSLSQIGIKTQPPCAALAIDAVKLTAALRDDLSSVQELFNGVTGISRQLNIVTSAFLGARGLFGAANDKCNRAIRDLQEQYDTVWARIEARITTDHTQFTALDTMLMQMNTANRYLTRRLQMP